MSAKYLDINHPKLLEIGADLIMGPEKKKELLKGTIEIVKMLSLRLIKVFKQLLTLLEDENLILSTLLEGF